MTSNLTKNLYAELDESDCVEEESYDDFDDGWDEDFEEHDWDDELENEEEEEDFDSIPAKRFSAKHECYEDD